MTLITAHSFQWFIYIIIYSTLFNWHKIEMWRFLICSTSLNYPFYMQLLLFLLVNPFFLQILILLINAAISSYWQIVSLIIEALAWCSILILIGIETKVYIREFRWFVRFGLIYAIVGDAVMFNLIISAKEFYSRFDHIIFTMLYSLLVNNVMICIIYWDSIKSFFSQ